MEKYTLPHRLSGEKDRLALMSTLLDPVELSWIARLGVGPGSRCLEFGCGNGSISVALARRVAPAGQVVASDIDLAFVSHLSGSNLEVRRIDVLEDAIEQRCYDFVTARALLHHLPAAHCRAASGLRAETRWRIPIHRARYAAMHSDRTALDERILAGDGWKWSSEAGIDYFIGRKTQPWLASLGLEDVVGEGFTPHFNGGSDWAKYWIETITELAPALETSGHLSPALVQEFMATYQDPRYWTSVISFVATWGRVPLS